MSGEAKSSARIKGTGKLAKDCDVPSPTPCAGDDKRQPAESSRRSSWGPEKSEAPADSHDPPAACGLLISIRSLAEAQEIADLPIEVVDFKEPDRGPLAPCDPAIWAEVVDKVTISGQWSVALGEIHQAFEFASQLPGNIGFAKAGPFGVSQEAELASHWCRLRRMIPPETELVAVAYADHRQANTLSVSAILDLAIEEGFRTLLIDTYSKGEMSSLAWLGSHPLHNLVQRAAECNLEIVLAGGLRLDALQRLQEVPLRRIAVRGAVCADGREGRVQRHRVEAWLAALRQRGFGQGEADGTRMGSR